MDIKELAKKVEEMRNAQKDYFNLRQPSVLKKSKDLEKALDEVIEDILHPDAKNQLKIF